MSAAQVAIGDGRPALRPTASRLADATVFFVLFISGFVMFEPAPYELVLVVVVVVWTIFGLRLNRHILPLIVLLGLYCFGGVIALTQSTTIADGFIYFATTVFLAISSIFFASIILEAPERRFRLIIQGYLSGSILVALIGIAAYFELFPGAEALKLAQRAAGTFQDPNVFGPFLILPAVYLARSILTNGIARSIPAMIGFLILALGIFLAFSRAAWGLTVVALLITGFLTFCTQPTARGRFRVLAYSIGLGLFIVAALAAALVIPGVSDLFLERAQLVQSYDGGQLGRIARVRIGISQIPEHPLGLGPFEFGRIYGADEHNTWLKGFTVYGWIGGFSYIALTLWTLAAGFPVLFKERPWLPVVQCAYAVFCGHLMIQMVIDNDHWRHFFLLFGLIWGAIAVEKVQAWRRTRAALRPAPAAAVPPFAAVAYIPR